MGAQLWFQFEPQLLQFVQFFQQLEPIQLLGQFCQLQSIQLLRRLQYLQWLQQYRQLEPVQLHGQFQQFTQLNCFAKRQQLQRPCRAGACDAGRTIAQLGLLEQQPRPDGGHGCCCDRPWRDAVRCAREQVGGRYLHCKQGDDLDQDDRGDHDDERQCNHRYSSSASKRANGTSDIDCHDNRAP